MSFTNKTNIYRVVVFFLIIHVNAQSSLKDRLVEGGQFKDLILPMPIIDELTSENIWGTKEVLPRDVNNGLESNDWSYWGGNPMLGNDGKYHITIARWPEEKGHWGWPKSEVTHAISNTPIGPYQVTGIALSEAHNPEVRKLNDGTYILHVSKGFIYTSDKLSGPWALLGKIEIDKRGHQGLSHLYTNLTGLQREDGSFLFFTKRGDVMISNTGLLGPYKIVASRNYDRYSGYPEDPVIWKSRHQYHVVFNHAVDKKSVYMRSLDGIHWKTEPGRPYDKTIFRYTDRTKNEWCKFERPKVLQDEYGRATHLSLAVIDVEKKEDNGNDNHNSKHVILPLVTERLIEIIRPKEMTSNTKVIKIRIKAEENYEPAKEINIQSLRLGVSDVVNYGGGSKPIKSEIVDKDLIVTFPWDSTELDTSNYDLKLLGKEKEGGLVFGYALLPQFSDNPASLVTLPVKTENNTLITEVENFGLTASLPSTLKIFQHGKQEINEITSLKIPALNPYQVFKVAIPLEGIGENDAYEVIISDLDKEPQLWHKVDDNNVSIAYKGNWKTSTEGQRMYMGSEQVTSEKGASATFYFTGTQGRCYGNISKHMGSFEVYIDGTFVEKIDCFFRADLHNTVIYQTDVLSRGLHTLELRATGKHYKGNPEAPVAIDAFSYLK